MSNHEQDNLDPGQRLARDAVRSLGTPAADPAFRERLKAQFAAGDIPEQPAFADSEPTQPRSRPGHLAAWYGWGSLTAAAVVIFALLNLNPLPGPQLVRVDGTGRVTVDGEALEGARPELIADRLHAGAHLQVDGDTSLDLQYPGAMVWRLEPGTDIVLPDRPGRWFRSRVRADLARGEVSVRTGPDLHGGELDVATPAGTAQVYGTLVNIMSNADLTCFCLHDGTAHVSLDGRDLGAIPPMKRRVVFTDGRAPELSDIAPPHLEHMLELDRDTQGIFAKDR